MATKRQRLLRLLKAQEQLKNLQEQKRDQLKAEVTRLERLGADVEKALESGGAAGTLFSDLSYQFLFRVAAERRTAEEAREETSRQAHAEKKRLERLQERFAAFNREEDREITERDNLENVDKVTGSKSSFRQV